MKRFFIVLSILSSILISCNDAETSTAEPVKQDSPAITKPSIIGKWYYNTEDDRYYYQFNSNGTAIYRYYQTGLSSLSGSFVSNTGSWNYLNSEQTKFNVSWSDSIGRWYDIVSIDDDKIVLEGDGNGPAGRGLGSYKTLYKTAKKYTYDINDKIKYLLGTWKYEDKQEGTTLTFNEDGSVSYHYYHTGSFSSLNGWSTLKGIWHYVESTNSLSITMTGEISYDYSISKDSTSKITLQRSDIAAGTSIIGNKLYLIK